MQNTEIYALPYLEVGDLVEDIAEQSKKFVVGVESVMLTSDFRGPQGDPGPPGDPGLPGVNAVPADEAVAAYLNATDTATRTAAGALFGDAATAALVGDENSATGAAVRALAGNGAASDDSVADLVTAAGSETRAAVVQAATALVAPVSAQLGQVMGTMLTVDDMEVSAVIPCAVKSGAPVAEINYSAAFTPYHTFARRKLVGISILHERDSLAASTTNFMGLTVRRLRNGVTTNIVGRDTKVSGLPARVPFDFAGGTWDMNAAVLEPGDAVQLALSVSNNTVKIQFPINVTLRFEPA